MTTTAALTPEQLQRAMRRSRQQTASRWRLFVNTPGRIVSCAILVVFALMAIGGQYLYPARFDTSVLPKN